MPMITVSGSRLHYRFEGEEGAPVLVLSNSLGTDLSLWDAQVPGFTRHFRLLRYDTRGHGASSAPPGPYTLAELVRDLLDLLDHLDLNRVHFCGLSLGGMIGMWLAIHAPERLERLVLCNTAARIGPPELWDRRIEAVQAGGMAAIADAVISRWFTPAFLEQQSGAVDAVRTVLLQTSPGGYIACCAAIRDLDLREAITQIRVPTLVIAGTHDLATPPADGHFLAEQISGARVIELAAAHLSNIEAPPAFTDAVTHFLTDREHTDG